MEVAERIGKRVKDLREERAWTQQRLAQKVGASQSTIAGVESGAQLPGTGLLSRLADTFRVGLDFFYREKESPFEMLLRAEEVGPETRGVLRRFTERCTRYSEIEKLAGVEISLAPAYEPPSKHMDLLAYAERIADEARRRLDIGTRPVCDLAEIVEGDGLRVMGMDAGRHFDGVFLYAEDQGGFALVNVNAAISHERRLFTLAHEYGHFLIHRTLGHRIDYDTSVPATNRIEMTANRFAAAFLMPKAALHSWWLAKGKDNLAELIVVRRSLGVSYRALGWRLVKMELISKQLRERLESDEDGLKAQEELLCGPDSGVCARIPELSDRQRLLALLAYQNAEVSVSKLADWLETDVVTADLITHTLRGEEGPSVPSAG